MAKQILLRKIFSPVIKLLLFKTGDYIRADFIDVMNTFAVKINEEIKPRNETAIMYWLAIIPKRFFEIIFTDRDESGEPYLQVLKNANNKNGRECAFITQAYILYNLEQILKNDKNYKKEIGYSIEDLEKMIEVIIGKDNKITQYLNYYREKFDFKKIGTPEFVDPRDWPIVYVWDICDLLITDKKILKNTMQEWNDSILKKTAFMSFAIQFIGDQKETVSKLLKESVLK